MQAIPAVGSQELNNAQLRNNGQQTGLLGGSGAIDGSMQSFKNLADPANIFGGSSSGHLASNILDPGNVLGFNQAANPNGQPGMQSPGMFPNLGAQSMIPMMPGGAFQNIHNGSGYNYMAAQGAGGKMFNPSVNTPTQGAGKPAQGTVTPPSKTLGGNSLRIKP